MDLFRLDGDVAFVTGAASGIGQRIAVGLAEAGADVACFDLPTCRPADLPTSRSRPEARSQPDVGSPAADVPEVGLEATAGRIRALGRRALVLDGDVTDGDSLTAAVAATEHDLGPLTVAVNAAGIANAAPAEDLPLEQWRRLMQVNVDGVFLSCQAQARVMLPRRRGSIVNIASMSGSIVNRGLTQAHYNASKAAVIHLGKSLAMEWSEHGVRVNSISPGYTLTPMNLRPEVAEQRRIFERDTPLGRMATVEEMVGPAVFLAGRAASFCTGVDLVVDGGFTCW